MILHSQSSIQSKRASLTQLTRNMTLIFLNLNLGVDSLPVKASTVTIYLASLIQSGCSVSVLNSNLYAVK